MKSARLILLMFLSLAVISWGTLAGGKAGQSAVSMDLVGTLRGHGDVVFTVAFSPNGNLLASGSFDKTIKLWEVSAGELVRTLAGHTDFVNSVAFSPDGQLLASGSDDTTIRLWNVATGQVVRTLRGHMDSVESVAFSLEGQLLASASRDKTVKLWKVATGRLIRTLRGHVDFVRSVTFSPDGRLLASGSGDRAIKLWKVATGQALGNLTGHRDWVWSVVFSPDGQFLASGSFDNTVKLWEVASQKCLHTLLGHTDVVNSVTFSPDTKLVASASNDTTIKLWDVVSGKEILMPSDHTGGVNSVAFSPNGKLLASGSDDKTIKLWKIRVRENQPPQTTFTFSPPQPRVGQSVRFDASASSDPDGTITDYTWNFGDSSTGSRKITTHAYDRSGRFTVTLTVTDNDGASDSTSKTITIIKTNQPPQAGFTYSPRQPTNLDAIQFTDQSTDPDGQVVKWHWNFGDGNASTKQNPSHRYEDEGTYKVTLAATDDGGASDSISKTITVIEANQPPQVTLIEFPELVSTEVETKGTIGFLDPDGDVSQAKFEVLEGPLTGSTLDLTQPPYAEAVQARSEGSFDFTLKVDQPGEYCIRVTLTDEAGLTSEPQEFSFEARTPTAPAITKVVFPSTIKVNEEQNGIVKFEDPDGDITNAEFEVVEGDPATIEVKPGMSFDPGVQGRTKSSFRFSVIVTKAQAMTLRLILIDSAGLKSELCEFTFEVN